MSDSEIGNRIRWTASRKAELVLAVLKGADVVELCRENGISRTQLFQWRDSFIEGGKKQLKFKRRKGFNEKKVTRLERKVGELTLQLEILHEVARLKKTKQLV